MLLRSCSGLDLLEGDVLAITLGFNGLKCYCDHGEVWDVPEGDALAITLGFNGLKCYCVDDVRLAEIYKNTLFFNVFW